MQDRYAETKHPVRELDGEGRVVANEVSLTGKGVPSHSGPPTRCAIYARTLRLRSGYETVESQIEICLAAAREQGLEVADDHIFADSRDKKVTFRERLGIKALLDAARSETHPFQIVFIDKNSRFSRKFPEILGIYSALSRAGVKVRVVSGESS